MHRHECGRLVLAVYPCGVCCPGCAHKVNTFCFIDGNSKKPLRPSLCPASVVHMEATPLKNWLQTNGVSMRRFAKAAGLSVGHVSKLANGQKRYTVDTAAAVERVTLGALKAADLCFGEP